MTMANLPKSSRRGFLGAVTAALGALTAPSDDPVFAAIERHKAAYARFCDACGLADTIVAKNEGREVTDADEAEREAADTAEAEALEALLDCPLSTPAGSRAMLEYLRVRTHKGVGMSRAL
jgi:hypothetical protein